MHPASHSLFPSGCLLSLLWPYSKLVQGMRLFTSLTLTLFLSGCVTQVDMAASEFLECERLAKLNNPVGAALVAVDGPMPSVKQTSITSRPSHSNLQAVVDYWQEDGNCSNSLLEKWSNMGSPAESAALYNIFNRENELRSSFIVGRQTWGEYFRAVAEFNQWTLQKVSDLDSASSRRPTYGSPQQPLFKPYCPKNIRYPIYGCD